MEDVPVEPEEKIKDLQVQIEKLSNKNNEILDELKAERKKRQQLDDEVDKEKKRIKDLEDEEKRKKATGDGDLEALKESYEEKIKAMQGEFDQKQNKFNDQLKRVTVDAQAKTLASELALPDSIDVLLPHIKSRLSLDSDSAKVVVLSESGELSASSLDDLKSELKGNKAFAPILRSSDASGGGANSGSGGGAATKKFSELSESERVELHRKDPDEYRKLRDKDK